MSGNRQKPEHSGTPFYFHSLLWGIAAECVVCCAFLLLLAGLLAWRDVPSKLVDPMMILVSAVAALSGGYLCARRTREKGMALGMLCGACLFVLLLLCSLMLTGTQVGGLLAVKGLSLLLGGALGGILGVNRRVKR